MKLRAKVRFSNAERKVNLVKQFFANYNYCNSIVIMNEIADLEITFHDQIPMDLVTAICICEIIELECKGVRTTEYLKEEGSGVDFEKPEKAEEESATEERPKAEESSVSSEEPEKAEEESATEEQPKAKESSVSSEEPEMAEEENTTSEQPKAEGNGVSSEEPEKVEEKDTAEEQPKAKENSVSSEEPEKVEEENTTSEQPKAEESSVSSEEPENAEENTTAEHPNQAKKPKGRPKKISIREIPKYEEILCRISKSLTIQNRVLFTLDEMGLASKQKDERKLIIKISTAAVRSSDMNLEEILKREGIDMEEEEATLMISTFINNDFIRKYSDTRYKIKTYEFLSDFQRDLLTDEEYNRVIRTGKV